MGRLKDIDIDLQEGTLKQKASWVFGITVYSYNGYDWFWSPITAYVDNVKELAEIARQAEIEGYRHAIW